MHNSLALLERLEAVTQTKPDTWRARCPSHEGRSRSLSLKLVDDRLLIHCFAGCFPNEIVNAAGLTISDLFDNRPNSTPAEYRDRIRTTSAREILNSIVIPIRAVMMSASIQRARPLTDEEAKTTWQAYVTINQALDTATTQGVINAS